MNEQIATIHDQETLDTLAEKLFQVDTLEDAEALVLDIVNQH